MTADAIAAEGVELTYADGTRAVRGIDLTVPRGEFFGFLGPNGAGKTTTIKTLVTILRPTAGSITVNGFDALVERRAVRETVGYICQETSIDPELTAREKVRFACDSYGVPRSERADRIDEPLDLVDLADVAEKRADDSRRDEETTRRRDGAGPAATARVSGRADHGSGPEGSPTALKREVGG